MAEENSVNRLDHIERNYFVVDPQRGDEKRSLVIWRRESKAKRKGKKKRISMPENSKIK